MHRDSCPLDCKIYVGNLGNNGNKTELEQTFAGWENTVWLPSKSGTMDGEKRSRNRGPLPSWGRHPRDDYRRRSPPPRRRSPRRRSFSCRSRSLSRDRRGERSLSRERYHKPSNERK
ncbi:hypothetical protein FD754_000799 [Muntiacus muntjak]|uniref:RRM domain-containing protein n=1 Tax=Muntiacus muntjak TaxID=9888 RepID=A0A5N3W595_MUNMU|nr:hypothetical protein FD754_000799 [Muntiacus muntjak]